jgi:hypothetical protein
MENTTWETYTNGLTDKLWKLASILLSISRQKGITTKLARQVIFRFAVLNNIVN